MMLPPTSNSILRHGHQKPHLALWFVLLLGLLATIGCTNTSPSGTPQELIHRGWTLFNQSEFQAAAAAFESALKSLDRSSSITPADQHHRLDALFGLAQTWDLGLRNEDTDTAHSLYNKIVTLAPSSDHAAWAQLALARRLHTMPSDADPDLLAARSAYQLVIDRFPNHPAADEALLLQQSTYVATLQPQPTRQALPHLLAYVSRSPQPRLLSSAYLLLSTAHATLGQEEQSVDALIKALESREPDPGGTPTDYAGAYWSIATSCEFRIGNFDLARKYYQLLIDHHPTDQRVFPAKQALERMNKLQASLTVEMNTPPG